MCSLLATLYHYKFGSKWEARLGDWAQSGWRPVKCFNIWCGEGDLNPHEIAPASTSS